MGVDCAIDTDYECHCGHDQKQDRTYLFRISFPMTDTDLGPKGIINFSTLDSSISNAGPGSGEVLNQVRRPDILFRDVPHMITLVLCVHKRSPGGAETMANLTRIGLLHSVLLPCVVQRKAWPSDGCSKEDAYRSERKTTSP